MFKFVGKILRNWPLRRQLGFYSFMPIFFAAGAALELTMIKLTINGVNFYSVYNRKQNEKLNDEIQVKSVFHL